MPAALVCSQRPVPPSTRPQQPTTFLLLLAVAAALLFLPGVVAAQQGILETRVVAADDGAPRSAAFVSIENDAGRTVATGLTNRDGVYRANVAPGVYRVEVSSVGYATERVDGITVSADGVTQTEVRLRTQAFQLDAVVVSVGREAEKALTAPARVEIITEDIIGDRPSTTPVDHLRSLPAVDVIQQGVQSTNVVVRGFNNIFSGALHTLTDNRIAGVPSLRVNVLNFIPTIDDDIERMEVVLGPGSALYGPNTANGVLHILTKSPLRDQGTTVSVMGGEQSLLAGAFRTSHLLTDNVGVKFSGELFRAEEWAFQDPVEVAEREKFDSNPAFWRADLMRAVGISQGEAEQRIDRIAARDSDLERWSGEVRADWAISDDATAIFTVGRSNASSQVEMTGLGAAQINDWSYTFYQARFNRDRLFAQFYLNESNAGNTFLLRNGAPIVDRSKLYVGQLQHGTRIGTRNNLTYGLDFLYTDPETEGTINGIYEDEDDTTEFGAYLQAESQLTPELSLVLAGRVDTHSALPDAIFSPRAALVYEPVEGQAFRATYNRAFSTPSSLNQFLDLGTAFPNAALAQLGYSVRVQGTGTEGFRFRQTGDYLMRSPFTPEQLGGPAQLLPANAAAFWQAAVQVAGAQNPDLANLLPFLASLNPTAQDIGSNFFNPVTGEVGSLASLERPDVDPIRESLQSTFELGYTGLIGGRALLAADVWYSRRSQLVTPLTIQTPFITMNGGQIFQYLVDNNLLQALQAQGLSPEAAQATVQQIAEGLASVPMGVLSSPDINANGAQLLSTYTNVDDDFDLWGVDLSARFLVNDRWSFAGSVSLVNDDSFTTSRGEVVTLNAPRRKGSASAAYRNRGSGLSAEGRVRVAAGFPASSGVYEGLACLPNAPSTAGPCVESSTLVDMNLSYRLPGLANTTAQLSVQNIFDTAFRSFPGTPEVGRMALLRLRYQF
ncbi:MAG: TonB-dependent receptor [Gemmatimonadales bacterium]|nr:MAG: TonB-dependent receptor [Gemmatimonadales bacterium]